MWRTTRTSERVGGRVKRTVQGEGGIAGWQFVRVVVSVHCAVLECCVFSSHRIASDVASQAATFFIDRW